MFWLWSVHLGHLREALDLASKLITDAGYPPNTREKGIVQWRDEEDSTHHCEICFKSFRGLYWNGYIGVNTCDCDDKWAFRDIITTFERELKQRQLIETLPRQLFNIAGSRSS